MDIGNLLGDSLQQAFGPTAIIYCLAAIGRGLRAIPCGVEILGVHVSRVRSVVDDEHEWRTL